MESFFWKQHSFWNDFKKETLSKLSKKLIISSAYLSLNSVHYLKALIESIDLKRDDIIIYISMEFNESQPAEILKELNILATVFIVTESFLHSKMYEIITEKEVIFYHGSANMTEGGLTKNIECMSKIIFKESPVSDLWDYLYKNSIKVNNEVIEIYKSYQKSLKLIPREYENTLSIEIENYKVHKFSFEQKKEISISEKLTSKDIDKYLMFLNNRNLKSNESLSFLKKIEGHIYEEDKNKLGKAIYTISKEAFWIHLNTIPQYKSFLEKRKINSFQQLSDRADIYYVEFFYE